jgi:hypothetical protein
MAKGLPTLAEVIWPKVMAPRSIELEAHHGLAGLLVEARRGVGQRLAAELDVFVQQF